MSEKRRCVVDTETNALELSDINRMHVVGYRFEDEEEVKVLTDPSRMKKFFQQDIIFICHNFIGYDRAVIKKLFDVDVPLENIIDSLGLSYYLYSDRPNHGLAGWGNEFGVPKPEVEDWEEQPIEVYMNRVSEDCKINFNLWLKQKALLEALYDEENDIKRIIKLQNFKLYELVIQGEEKIKIDTDQAQKNLDFLQGIAAEKKTALEAMMPKVPKHGKKNKPVKFYNKSGEISALGIKWIEFLKENGISEDYEGTVEYVTGYEEPNAGSSIQVKDFLFKMGWKPKIFKDGANGKVPQLRDDEKMLCQSVLELAEKEPAIKHLEGLSVAEHRAGYLKGFLSSVDENGYAAAKASGWTRTLRLCHKKPFANLPRPSSQYGELVRGVMIAPEGYILVGSDISSLEDNMKKINIWKYDQDFVESMDEPGWDPHLALGLNAGLILQEEVDFYKWYKNPSKTTETMPPAYVNTREDQWHDIFNKINDKRATCKTATYALTYGCGVPKLMDSAKISRAVASSLHSGYWNLNKAVKEYSADRIIKEVDGRNWIWNDVSKFWYYLKADKDRFSSCNSSGGVAVFDTWLYFMIEAGLRPLASFHDEVVLKCKPEEYENVSKILKSSMEKVNKVFKFPIEIKIDIQQGLKYSEVH